MEDCIFCKIMRGEIPCYKIYEDEETLAFLDISKDCLGHTLVIPKKHSKNILDAEKETLSIVMNTVQKISNHYVSHCGFDGINIVNNNNESAQQSVNHLHIHIIPRKEGDSLQLFSKLNKLDLDLERVANKLKFN